MEAYRDLDAFPNEDEPLRGVFVARGNSLVDNDLEIQVLLLKVRIKVDLDERAIVFLFPLESAIERVGDNGGSADRNKSI